MPIDMQLYWTEIDGGDWDTPPVPAPIWQFCDEEDIPETMSFVDETGLVLVEG